MSAKIKNINVFQGYILYNSTVLVYFPFYKLAWNKSEFDSARWERDGEVGNPFGLLVRLVIRSDCSRTFDILQMLDGSKTAHDAVWEAHDFYEQYMNSAHLLPTTTTGSQPTPSNSV